jgi:hypothetical protein
MIRRDSPTTPEIFSGEEQWENWEERYDCGVKSTSCQIQSRNVATQFRRDIEYCVVDDFNVFLQLTRIGACVR